MGLSEPKNCKCGHSKETHQKKPNSKLSPAASCKVCPCTHYLDRNFPKKSDWAYLIFAIGIGLFLIVSFSIVYLEANPELLGTEETEITFTLGEIYEFLGLVFIAAILFAAFWFVIDPIVDFLALHKRRKFPLED